MFEKSKLNHRQRGALIRRLRVSAGERTRWQKWSAQLELHSEIGDRGHVFETLRKNLRKRSTWLREEDPKLFLKNDHDCNLCKHQGHHVSNDYSPCVMCHPYSHFKRK